MELLEFRLGAVTESRQGPHRGNEGKVWETVNGFGNGTKGTGFREPMRGVPQGKKQEKQK